MFYNFKMYFLKNNSVCSILLKFLRFVKHSSKVFYFVQKLYNFFLVSAHIDGRFSHFIPNQKQSKVFQLRVPVIFCCVCLQRLSPIVGETSVQNLVISRHVLAKFNALLVCTHICIILYSQKVKK